MRLRKGGGLLKDPTRKGKTAVAAEAVQAPRGERDRVDILRRFVEREWKKRREEGKCVLSLGGRGKEKGQPSYGESIEKRGGGRPVARDRVTLRKKNTRGSVGEQ